MWIRTLQRWDDTVTEKEYGIHKYILRGLFAEKCKLIKQSRDSWPRYATHDEAIKLRGPCWNDRYGNHRVVQWDNTDIHIGKPPDTRKQRATFSFYYGGNCVKKKGGVYNYVVGWVYMNCGQVEFQTHNISINLVFLSFKRNLQWIIW